MLDKTQLLPHNQHLKVYDHASALKWIEDGKDPENKRPLYERGLYVFKTEDNNVSVAPYWAKDNPVVIYEPNGLVVLPINHNYYRASWRRIALNYANLKSFQRRNRMLLIATAGSKETPTKERRCGNCSGQRKHTFLCTGQDGWRNVTLSSNKTLQIHLDCSREGDARQVPHREQADCHRCQATGKVPWGGKPIPMEWDGQKPLRLNIVTGEISQEEPTEG